MNLPTIDWTELSLQVMTTFGHFLWQACVVAIALAIVEQLPSVAGHAKGNDRAQDSRANMRYVVASLAFFALPICVVATFTRIHQLPLEQADGDTKVLVEFFGEESKAIVAKGKHLYTIDFASEKVIATIQVEKKIQHLSVAVETGDFVFVDVDGGMYLCDQSLERSPKITDVNLELPPPVLSPEAARIATYRAKDEGRVYVIKNGIVANRIDIPLENASEPLELRSTRVYDLWIEKNRTYRRPHYPNTAGDDLKSWPITVYWDLEQTFPATEFPTEHWQTCIANRTLEDGSRQRVVFDAYLGHRYFARPIALNAGDRKVYSSHLATTFVIYDDKLIDLHYRLPLCPQGLHRLRQFGRDWSWQNRFDTLENLHTLLRSLPERRMMRTPEQLYTEVVGGIVDQWLYTEELVTDKDANENDKKLATERLPAFGKWAETKSVLAQCAAMQRHSRIAWKARGGGWAGNVGQSAWKTFETENERAVAIWEELKKEEDLPATALTKAIVLSRDTGASYDMVADSVERFLYAYPHDDYLHRQIMSWKLEKWGGERGSGPAYAAAVSKAIGPPMGDFIYSRCIEQIQGNFQHAFFNYEFIEGNRVLAGIRQGLDMGYFQEASTMTSMYMLHQSHGRPDAPASLSSYGIKAKQLTEDLAEYYKVRYPMLTEDSVRKGRYKMLYTYLPY